jgi:hypothetical protein
MQPSDQYAGMAKATGEKAAVAISPEAAEALPKIKGLKVEETWVVNGVMYARGLVTYEDGSTGPHVGPLIPIVGGDGKISGYTLASITPPEQPSDLDILVNGSDSSTRYKRG